MTHLTLNIYVYDTCDCKYACLLITQYKTLSFLLNLMNKKSESGRFMTHVTLNICVYDTRDFKHLCL